jgi:hypothetical protein
VVALDANQRRLSIIRSKKEHPQSSWQLSLACCFGLSLSLSSKMISYLIDG